MPTTIHVRGPLNMGISPWKMKSNNNKSYEEMEAVRRVENGGAPPAGRPWRPMPPRATRRMFVRFIRATLRRSAPRQTSEARIQADQLDPVDINDSHSVSPEDIEVRRRETVPVALAAAAKVGAAYFVDAVDRLWDMAGFPGWDPTSAAAFALVSPRLPEPSSFCLPVPPASRENLMRCPTLKPSRSEPLLLTITIVTWTAPASAVGLSRTTATQTTSR